MDERKIWVIANEVFSARGTYPSAANIHFDKSNQNQKLLDKMRTMGQA